jgi:hypothetical protein
MRLTTQNAILVNFKVIRSTPFIDELLVFCPAEEINYLFSILVSGSTVGKGVISSARITPYFGPGIYSPPNDFFGKQKNHQ